MKVLIYFILFITLIINTYLILGVDQYLSIVPYGNGTTCSNNIEGCGYYLPIEHCINFLEYNYYFYVNGSNVIGMNCVVGEDQDEIIEFGDISDSLVFPIGECSVFKPYNSYYYFASIFTVTDQPPSTNTLPEKAISFNRFYKNKYECNGPFFSTYYTNNFTLGQYLRFQCNDNIPQEFICKSDDSSCTPFEFDYCFGPSGINIYQTNVTC